MPKYWPSSKSVGRKRKSLQITPLTKKQPSPLKGILKNVNLNEYMSMVSDVVKLEARDGPENDGTKSNINFMNKKRVKFSDVVQAFSIGDGWKISTFVEKLKSEVDQQDRSKRLRDCHRKYMTKFNHLPKSL